MNDYLCLAIKVVKMGYTTYNLFNPVELTIIIFRDSIEVVSHLRKNINVVEHIGFKFFLFCTGFNLFKRQYNYSIRSKASNFGIC